MPDNELYQRVVKAETLLASLEVRMEKQESNNEVLTRFVQLTELQLELNKDMKDQLQKTNNIMSTTQIDVATIKNDMNYVKQEIGELDERTSDLEDDQEEVVKEKMRFWTDNMGKIITTIISSVAVAAIILWLNLK
jgi:translation initiation factor 2B subunit (eIF-2B alpha/beta/delta family)